MTGVSPDGLPKWRVEVSSVLMRTALALLFLGTYVQQAAALNAEGIALSSFRNAITGDPKNVFRNWNASDATPCGWSGVSCSPDNQVVRLFLNGAGVVGTVSGALGQLNYLRTLSLSQNSLSGVIPPELSSAVALYKLNLSRNALSGVVPAGLGNLTGLRMLDLSANSLSGPLPSTLFQNCQKLRYFDLSHNALSGTIPTALGSCLSVTGINLSTNKFEGHIPGELGNLRQLMWLFLGRNLLSGPIPSQLSNCTKLESLSLGLNSLTGSLPEELGSLNSLSTLALQENFLGGTVSTSLVFKPTVLDVNLSSNAFTGNLPAASSGSCESLQFLDLSKNNFSGPIPDGLNNCPDLRELRLSSNQLSSSIPLALGMLLNLDILDLSTNNLSGIVPTQLGNLSRLIFVNMSRNPIYGPIPDELGRLGRLQTLDLHDMRLTGSLPDSLASLKSLSTLDVSNNDLAGTIPESMTALSNLTVLDLSVNFLNGSIPAELQTLTKLQNLDLSNNSFAGTIPSSLGSLSGLQVFNVSFNDLTGAIPRSGSLSRFNQSSFLGNQGLCGPPLSECGSSAPLGSPTLPPLAGGRPSSDTHLLSTSSIIAISAAAFIAVAVFIVTLMNLRAVRRKRRRNDVFVYESPPPSPDISPIVGKLVLFSKSLPSRYEDWEAGTKALLDKDYMIGKGSLGAVYKATFEGELSIAVKKLDSLGRIKNQEDFEHEMGVLGNLKPHPHLVPLQGYYWSSAMQLLLSDFVPNESLFFHLHQQSGPRTSLNWRRRFKIALGTARGLAYLHHDCKPPILHFNLKASNILLDDNFEAKVTDYGLGKLLPMLDTYVSSQKFLTTLGYVAPELACQSLRLTEKCDVYSFGMILLELVTGRQPVESFDDNVIVLGDTVRAALERGRRVSACIDSRLEPVPESEVAQVLKLGLICTSQNPSKRPTMAEVVQVLESIKSSSNSSRAASAHTSSGASTDASGAASP